MLLTFLSYGEGEGQAVRQSLSAASPSELRLGPSVATTEVSRGGKFEGIRRLPQRWILHPIHDINQTASCSDKLSKSVDQSPGKFSANLDDLAEKNAVTRIVPALLGLRQAQGAKDFHL